MVRETLINKGVGKGDIRWRSMSVSRIEGFSDAVFAFGITLLIVSLEVPATFDDLVSTMKGFLAFGVSFAVVLMIWYQHYLFFRRFDLHDMPTHLMNMALIFIVLFYMYPLKFMATFLIKWYSGQSLVVALGDGSSVPMIEYADLPALTIIYGVGYGLVFLIFGLLYLHAYRKFELLELTRLERHVTLQAACSCLVHTFVAMVSIILCVVLPYYLAIIGGVIYFMIGPLAWWNAKRFENIRAGWENE